MNSFALLTALWVIVEIVRTVNESNEYKGYDLWHGRDHIEDIKWFNVMAWRIILVGATIISILGLIYGTSWMFAK